MNISKLLKAMNTLEEAECSIHGRPIGGCHFEIGPDGSGCLKVRAGASLPEIMADSPIVETYLEFETPRQLDRLCSRMISEPGSICRELEEQIAEQIATPGPTM